MSSIRAIISNAFYDARNAGETMETAATNAADGVGRHLADLLPRLIATLDYDLHKQIEQDEETGENTYWQLTAFLMDPVQAVAQEDHDHRALMDEVAEERRKDWES